MACSLTPHARTGVDNAAKAAQSLQLMMRCNGHQLAYTKDMSNRAISFNY